jgi:hypothetical protein
MSPRVSPMLASILAALGTSSCWSGSVDASGGEDSKTATAEGSPVSSAPLGGKVAGTPFTAKGSYSRPFGADPTMKVFEIFDVDANCETGPRIVEDQVLAGDGKRLQVIAPWPSKAGTVWPSGREAHGATANIESTNVVANAVGRIEVGAVGETTATLRIRAQTSDSALEGEVQVNVCP